MPEQETINPAIYDADQMRDLKGRKIYLDEEGREGKDRRYFRTAGATVYAEPFLKNSRGHWVGEVSGRPDYGQRLILTVRGTWILNSYTASRQDRSNTSLRPRLRFETCSILPWRLGLGSPSCTTRQQEPVTMMFHVLLLLGSRFLASRGMTTRPHPLPPGEREKQRHERGVG